jgi:hypothetical protein
MNLSFLIQKCYNYKKRSMNISTLIRRFRSYVPPRFRHSSFARSFFAFYQSLILLGVGHGIFKGI